MSGSGARTRKRGLSSKGAAAAAAALCIGIDKDKSLTHQRLFVVKRRAIQVEKALRINEDAGAERLENLVAVAGLPVEAHRVGQPGATAALDADTQPPFVRSYAFFGEQVEDFLRCALGDVNLGSSGISDFCAHGAFVRVLSPSRQANRPPCLLPESAALPLRALEPAQVSARASRIRLRQARAWSSSC